MEFTIAQNEAEIVVTILLEDDEPQIERYPLGTAISLELTSEGRFSFRAQLPARDLEVDIVYAEGINMSRPKLYIYRGLPGSGKTTAAKASGFELAAADDYFTSTDGSYNFNAMKIGAAHAYCYKKVDRLLRSGKDVAVHNTFTQHWELKPYLDMAKKYGADVKVFRMQEMSPEILFRRNVHNVPMEAIIKMKERFQSYPGEIVVEHSI